MTTGYYKIFNSNNNEIETALEKIKIPQMPYQETAIVFLHGDCDVFAQALHELYQYKIIAINDDDGHMVHTLCVNDKYLIDVRGQTTDMKTCQEPFEDFFIRPSTQEVDPNENVKALKNTMGPKAYAMYKNIAHKIIQDHPEYYQPI